MKINIYVRTQTANSIIPICEKVSIGICDLMVLPYWKCQQMTYYEKKKSQNIFFKYDVYIPIKNLSFRKLHTFLHRAHDDGVIRNFINNEKKNRMPSSCNWICFHNINLHGLNLCVLYTNINIYRPWQGCQFLKCWTTAAGNKIDCKHVNIYIHTYLQ